MINSRLILTLLIYLLTSYYNYSQTDKELFQINWLDNKKLIQDLGAENPTPLYHLYFEGAVFNKHKNLLPVFSKLLPLKKGHEAKVTNKKFKILSSKELSNVIDLEKIPERITANSVLRYSRKKPFLNISFIPLRRNPQTKKIEKLVSFNVEFIKTSANLKTAKSTKKRFTNNSVLSSGNWVKIKISKTGIYRLSFDQLQALGISSPNNLRIFGNGGGMLPEYNNIESFDDLVENQILIRDNYVYFYGVGPINWSYNETDQFFYHKRNIYTDYAYYYLSDDYNSNQDNIIKNDNQPSSAPTHIVTEYTQLNFHELDTLNLIGSGKLWVGEHFDFEREYNFSLNSPKLVEGSTIKAYVSLVARSPVSSNFNIKLNNTSFETIFPSVSMRYDATFAIQKKEFYQATPSNSDKIDLKITYNKSSASSEGWLDFICLNSTNQLSYSEKQLQFRTPNTVGTGNISRFRINNASNSVIIWDVSNPYKPLNLNTNSSGNILEFIAASDSLREFIAFSTNDALSPIIEANDLGKVENQNLHGVNRADLIIICHPKFIDQANELKRIHENEDNISAALFTTEQVFNEFSSGIPDVSAIRNFLKMLYDRADTEEELPKYLCLFGDGSYNNKHNFDSNTNYIPTYQSDNSLSPTESFVTDDYFGLLDDNEGAYNGLVDIGIGRIPVKTIEEAESAIQKIKKYKSIKSYTNWRNRICFVADDEDGNMHQRQSNDLSKIVKNNHPEFNIEKIFIDAYQQESSSAGQRYPDVNQNIDNIINKGVLLWNYTGHGGESGLAEERILSIEQINKWSNNYKLPVFMTATCEFSRFDNYKKVTAGEHVFLHPNGGAIAMFTTTRLVYSTPNYALNTNFYNYVFKRNPATNTKYRLGDIMRLTKNATGSDINKRNFALLGDPALELAYAPFNIKTTTINNHASSITDTIKALDKITIKGEITDLNGNKLQQYNGIIYPAIYDKEQEVKTLNNDGDGIFSYSVRNNILYKGKASVKNGSFSFSFITPKDIKYNIDTGKISYYSSNEVLNNDAKGSFKNILIGGTGSNMAKDTKGPNIQLYLNDLNFVSGGITNEKPKLLANLNDESGINTTGNGIGHDIVVTIDDNPGLKFTLNDYYESNIDDFTSGQVNYTFPKLEPGEHKLHLKVWDVYNNSSEDSLFFNVVDSEKLKINHVLNYPNPFSTNTSFFFEHNRPNIPLEVIVHIFTVSGKIIKTIHSSILNNGFRSEGIPWDGRDDFGHKIGRGVYFYKISVKTDTGEKAEKLQKLLILN